MRKVGKRFVIPMYHPAAALHQPKWRPQILADFAKLPKQLEQAKAALANAAVVNDEPPDEEPTQLSLF
jgi:DNA polymerase